MKYVLYYENSPETREKAPLHIAEHRARFQDFHRRGLMLMCGPLTDDEGGALGVFVSRRAAEDFIEGDPFVRKGVVGSWRIREWNEVLAGP